MAVLVGIQREDGVWDNFVLSRAPRYYCGTVDVLGRAIPCFRYLEAYYGVDRKQAERLAKVLKGVPKAKRRDAFLDHAKGLRLRAKGGRMT